MVTPRSVRSKHAAQIRAATRNARSVPFGVRLRVARVWAPASRLRRDPVPLTMLLFFAGHRLASRLQAQRYGRSRVTRVRSAVSARPS